MEKKKKKKKVRRASEWRLMQLSSSFLKDASQPLAAAAANVEIIKLINSTRIELRFGKEEEESRPSKVFKIRSFVRSLWQPVLVLRRPLPTDLIRFQLVRLLIN